MNKNLVEATSALVPGHETNIFNAVSFLDNKTVSSNNINLCVMDNFVKHFLTNIRL